MTKVSFKPVKLLTCQKNDTLPKKFLAVCYIYIPHPHICTKNLGLIIKIKIILDTSGGVVYNYI
jgi:hypothetical protein